MEYGKLSIVNGKAQIISASNEVYGLRNHSEVNDDTIVTTLTGKNTLLPIGTNVMFFVRQGFAEIQTVDY